MGEDGGVSRGRFLVKLSGEYLGGPSGAGLSDDRLKRVCNELKRAHAASAGLAVVVGGGELLPRGCVPAGIAQARHR